jgi:hypothetical protein
MLITPGGLIVFAKNQHEGGTLMPKHAANRTKHITTILSAQ